MRNPGQKFAVWDLDPDKIPHEKPAGVQPVDRLFLDVNILFSAAYKPGSPLRQLWQLGDVELITSAQGVLEAFNNLSKARPARLGDLVQLLQSVRILGDPLPGFTLPAGINLPDKDKPILRAAIDAQATHLLS
jgi:hypothetical protein